MRPKTEVLCGNSYRKHLEHDFGGNSVKLCGSRTWMKPNVAESRKQTLLSIFNFLYNSEATIENLDFHDSDNCKSIEETKNTMNNLFELSDAFFTKELFTGTEEEGFIKFLISREPSRRLGIAFVNTQFKVSEISNPVISIYDIVPYNGLVTFPSNTATASFFITIIKDQKIEPDERFEVSLQYITVRFTFTLPGVSVALGIRLLRCCLYDVLCICGDFLYHKGYQKWKH